jgi:hypothetical protein
MAKRLSVESISIFSLGEANVPTNGSFFLAIMASKHTPDTAPEKIAKIADIVYTTIKLL